MISVEDDIKAALIAAFMPSYFKIEDESQFHHRGEQTHYKVVIVSEVFDGITAVKRHQKVYGALDDIMKRFHALALHTFTPAEWQKKGGKSVAVSPICHGGSLHDLYNK